MKLLGHLTLEKVNELTGEIIEVIEQDNIITDIAYNNTNMTLNCNWSANRIFISTETAIPTRTKTTIQCSGTAYQGAGQPGILNYHNANPPYFVITQRLDSVVSARTFQTVGLTPDNPGQVVNTSVTPWAYLLLNTPCTQDANQILNLTYRITVQESGLSNTLKVPYPRWINDVCYNLTFNTGVRDYFNYLYNTVANAPLKEYNWEYLHVASNLVDMLTPGGQRGVDLNFQGNQNTLFFRNKKYWSFNRSNTETSNGRLLNGILAGRNETLKTGAVQSDPGTTTSAHSSHQTYFTSNLQSAFSYSAAPPTIYAAMFLPDNNPSGSGILSFSEDPWTGTWPTIYRIKITESGAVGTAKYVLGIKHFASFAADNVYTFCQDNRSFHPYIHHLLSPYTKCHGWQLVAPISAWDDKWTVQADANGLSIINQFTGQHYDFDSTTTPSLPITNLRQFALDKPRNLIYIACSATGIWKLDITNKASVVITNESTTPAYAIDVDKDGIVYAFVNVSSTALILTSSASSYVTNLGFSSIALTTSNWLNIYVNKIHADTRIAIGVRTATTTLTLRGANIYWWSLASGNSSNNYTTNIQFSGDNQNSLAWVKGSDNRFWASDGSLFSFNSSTMINSGVAKTNLININILGSQVYDITSYRLLDNTQLPSTGTRYIPAQICQDNWGYLIPNAITNTKMYIPSTGALFTSYNHELVNSGNSVQLNSIYSTKQVMLDNGVYLSNTAATYLHNNGMNSAVQNWIWYKWDGTNWIKAVDYNANTNTWTDTTSNSTKTTSTSYAPLLDGINVRFTNGTSEPSFVVGEVYDQYVAKGILKTNDTTLSVEGVTLYTQPVFSKITLTPTVITSIKNHGVVLDGAPGNSTLSAATSAIPVNPLWYATIPEYTPDNMLFTIDGIPVTVVFAETINTIPAQNTLTTGRIILYRNGLILCSTADVNKTLAGYFSYVAKSD